MPAPIYRIESSSTEEEHSESQLPPRYEIESSSSEEEEEEVQEERNDFRIIFARPGHHIFGPAPVEPPLRVGDLLFPPERVPPSTRPVKMRFQNGPLDDDDYEYDIEEGSTITICRLIFRFLLEMTMKVIRFSSVNAFTDRSEEMAIFFANVLFLAGIKYEISNTLRSARQGMKQFTLTVIMPESDVDYQITIAVPLSSYVRLIQRLEFFPCFSRLAKAYTCKSDDYRRALLRDLIYHMKIDEEGTVYGEEAHTAFMEQLNHTAVRYEKMHLLSTADLF